jgi:Cof subfamily protein (haloacid dehalogenase superfamily)
MSTDSLNIKALALDLDGTALLPDTSMGERTVTVLKKLIAQGMQVLLCTGRAIEAAERYRTAIGARGPMVYFNGAEVVDMPAGTVLSSTLLELDVADFCIDMSRDMDAHFQMFLPPGIIEGADKWEALVIDKPRPESEMYRNHTGITPIARDLKTVISAPALHGCVKAMFICEPALHDTIRAKVLERFGSRIYVARTFPTFLEIMNAGVSKGEGLKTALHYRGLTADTALAIGDEENDLLMFDVSGLSAAPSNARENVRARADFVFGSNAAEGIAAFLEEKFL